MIIFGTIGVFVRYIPLPSSAVALTRASVGVLFLGVVMLFKKHRLDFENIKRNLLKLGFAGACLGINWILLFESYRFTTVAVGTLCYYLAPTFVIILSPFVLREKLTKTKIFCVLVALFGMALVSGIVEQGFNKGEFKGVILGVLAAAVYATIVLLNKKVTCVSSFDVTVFELFISAVVLLPYVLLTVDFSGVSFDYKTIILLGVVGVVHTGIAYALYFGSIVKISAATIAVESYIDPVCAVILSATVLKEGFSAYTIFGAVLIIGASLLSELKITKNVLCKPKSGKNQ